MCVFSDSPERAVEARRNAVALVAAVWRGDRAHWRALADTVEHGDDVPAALVELCVLLAKMVAAAEHVTVDDVLNALALHRAGS